MIDTHAHIDTEMFEEDREEMLQRAWHEGIECIIIPDIKPPTRPHLKAIVDANPRLFRGVGIHPHHVHEGALTELELVEQQASEQSVVAIGEIGLDYYYNFCDPMVQKSYFRSQLQIAKRCGLPVIVHDRDSSADLLQIIEEEQDGSLRGVLHCFSGNTEVLQRAISLGMHVSFTGNITFKKSTLSDVVASVPEGRFMIETDSPYITPVPFRGKRNEPSFVRFTAQKIAEIRSMSIESVITETTQTARKLFALTLLCMVLCVTAWAQPQVPDEDDYKTDHAYDLAIETYELDSIAWSRWLKPRKLGIGLSFGSNTEIQLQTYTQRFTRGVDNAPDSWTTFPTDSGPSVSRSFNGLVAFGGTLTYGLSDRFLVEATYLYSNNVGPARDYGLDPITTQFFEATLHYSLNPYNKINFLAQVGATYATISGADAGANPQKIGINAGLGIGINLPTSIGLFYPVVNLRYNIMLTSDFDRVVSRSPALPGDIAVGKPVNEDFMLINPNNPNQISIDKADINTIYSIPRFTLLFYPNF